MERSRILFIVLAIAACSLAGAAAGAQTGSGISGRQPEHVRRAEPRPMPFSPDSSAGLPATAVEFRSYDRMSPQDRDLAADAESSIGERAGFAGLEFNQGRWSYREIACAALPGHLFLEFTRNNGAGDLSLFSASIPRDGNGRVRIIPIVRRGYSLFSPAPINALTISAFNHIRAEERQETESAEGGNPNPGWLATGLCYAALAGAHPRIESMAGPPQPADFRQLPSVPPGRLVIPLRGGALISFFDVSEPSRPMLWTMTFNGKGKLLKATHRPAPRAREKAVERKPAEVKGKPVQATDPTAKAILIR